MHGVLKRWMVSLELGRMCSKLNIHISIGCCSDILYLKTVHYVRSLCMSNRIWPAAIVYGEIALPAFRKYYGERSKVVTGVLVR